MEPTTIYQRPAELLQQLIRFDTTNPPGNEAACIAYIDGLLKSLGIETTLYEKVPGRPNLIARIKGAGSAPPLLLYGHVDVVPVTGQQWTYPPFAAEIHEGMIWGRGALDMKGGVAMMLAAFLRAKAEASTLPGDVIFLALSDEEGGGDVGARFICEEHPGLLEGVRYALGEFGGFTLYIGGKRFYPIQIAEKQMCWMRATFSGPAGHGSMPHRSAVTATYKAGRFLQLVNTQRLPVQITPAARLMFETMAQALPAPLNGVFGQLLNPAATDAVLDEMGEQARMFDSMLHNTISPNLIYGGDKINVIPAEVSVELDGRMLPGMTPDAMLAEIRAIAGDDFKLEVVRSDAGPGEPDMGLFETLADILVESDGQGMGLPLLLPAITDARFFAQIGIQTYGYTPMTLPEDFNFLATVHAADERIPVAAVEFGTNAIFQALLRFS